MARDAWRRLDNESRDVAVAGKRYEGNIMLRFIGSLACLAFLMAACGGGDRAGGGAGGVIAAPSDLQYGGTTEFFGAVDTPYRRSLVECGSESLARCRHSHWEDRI